MSEESSASDKRAAARERLEALKRRREKERDLNFREVVKEDERSKIDPKEEARRENERREAEKLLAKQEAKQQGIDYQREKYFTYTAEEAEKWEELQEKKKQRADTGFIDYRHASFRQNERMLGDLKVDKKRYQELKEQTSTEEFYRDANSLLYADANARPQQDDIDRLLEGMKKQEARGRKAKKSRSGHEDNIDYINERNRNFNQKIAKAFDPYTNEIKQNLERGTAL